MSVRVTATEIALVAAPIYASVLTACESMPENPILFEAECDAMAQTATWHAARVLKAAAEVPMKKETPPTEETNNSDPRVKLDQMRSTLEAASRREAQS